MDLYGIGIEQNQELGTEYCLDDYWGFRASVEKSYGFDVGSMWKLCPERFESSRGGLMM